MRDSVQPFPRAQEGGCSECGGPVHPYEADLSVDERTGKLICGACTRARLKRIGPDRRSIRKQHVWRPGHDPYDDEATPESGYTYVTLQPEKEKAVSEKAKLKGGPESGIKCFDCGTPTRLVAAASVEQLLKPLGYKPPEGTSAPKEKVLFLICPKCERVVQWRESFYIREKARQARE